MARAGNPIGVAGALSYAAGSFGTGVFSTVPSILLLFFCTEVLHIPPAWATVIVFAPKAWAIVWDPLVGAWSDRTNTRLGRRRPFLIAGMIGVVVSFVALFSPPVLPVGQMFWWTAASYFALATLYSLFAVPYIALPAEIAEDAPQRAQLVSWRITVAMIGVLAGAGVAPLLVERGGGGLAGYAFMAAIIAAACAVAMSAPILMLRGRDVARTEHPAHGAFLTHITAAVRHRAFLALGIAYVLQITAVGIVSAATPYLVTQAFGRSEGDIGRAMLIMLTATTVTIPLWAWLGRRIGERTSLVLAVIVFGVGTALLGLLSRLGADWTMALCVFGLIGVPFAGMQVLPFTMVAHLIHEVGADGSPAEGAFTGLWTAMEKLGLAFGPALTGLALTAVNGDIAHGLSTFVIGAPLVLALASLPLLATRHTAPPVSATSLPQ